MLVSYLAVKATESLGYLFSMHFSVVLLLLPVILVGGSVDSGSGSDSDSGSDLSLGDFEIV